MENIFTLFTNDRTEDCLDSLASIVMFAVLDHNDGS